MADKIIFVYNANSTIFSKATDFAHKIISPKTYACSLCAITYGSFSMEKKWKDYLSQVDFKFDFLYKDNFEKMYPNLNMKLPTVLITHDTTFETLINATELNSIEKLKDLIELLQTKLDLFNLKNL